MGFRPDTLDGGPEVTYASAATLAIVGAVLIRYAFLPSDKNGAEGGMETFVASAIGTWCVICAVALAF